MSEEGKSAVVFHINGEKHIVGPGSGVDAHTALVDYIRDVVHLKGTKVMCREGGCGACTVRAKVIDPATGSAVVKSVNSCLTPVLSCDGWDIFTVENLGNKHEGYHEVQQKIVGFYGTQCGYCTPGMVMNMYSLLESNKTVSVEDVEKNLDGNLCRCTGYRPILDAFKSLANDCPPEIKQKCLDIEECGACPKRKEGNPVACCAKPSTMKSLKLDSGKEWVTAKSFEDALSAAACNTKVRFVAGNTSTGIFKNEGPYEKFIDILGIPDLKRTNGDSNGITFGGATTLTELISLLRNASNLPGLEYGNRVALHLERVANVSVRNNGTIAGNLMIKHKYDWFPSDLFVILEALAATVTLVSAKPATCFSSKTTIDEANPITMLQFLSTDMSLKLIKSIHLPKHEGCHYRSFKITRRYQNAHAYVNAALLLKINKDKDFTVEGRPRLVYGGISAKFIHASATEAILQGKSLADEKTLKIALETLEKEVKPEEGPLESAPAYRVQLAKGLLYKTILEIVGSKASDRIKSGAEDIPRNISSSKQFIDHDKSATAIYKTVPKREASIQASGEAEYTGDIPPRPDELFAAYVLSTEACADIKDIDASEALKIPGVVRFVSAKDVPGENDWQKFAFMMKISPEPVFADKTVHYHGESIGLILATSQQLAHKAAKLVKVAYTNIQKPVVTVEEATKKAKEAGTFAKQTMGFHKTKPSALITPVHNVKGTLRTGSQYHFYMEEITAVCHPREDGIDVYCTSQGTDFCQNTVAAVLGIPSNCVNVEIRRLGGSFGGKGTRPAAVTSACAVASWVTRRPVRLVLDLETNMSMVGKRHPYIMPYEVGFDDKGRIGSLKADFIDDSGFAPNEPSVFGAAMHFQNVYKAIGWEADTHFVATNTPSNTFCRAPASVKAVALIETIMDQIAYNLKMDPIDVRLANMLETGDEVLFQQMGETSFNRENLIPSMIEHMKKNADYENRKAFVEKFNKQNRWKKRGLAVVPVRYEIGYFDLRYPASIAIYHMDGDVAVSHGGIEMGQGLNTKVIQAVAQGLGIPMERIKVKPTNSFVAANAMLTGGSIASEVVCYSVMKACEQLRENLRPVLEKLENPTWDKLISEAYNAKVNLSASYCPDPAKDDIKPYDVWVLNLTEVEIDVITGEYKIVRTDLYEDTGKSLSPGIDLGQIEGGYLHGQGYWTTEKIVHDEKTGKLLTNGTWDYKVPETKDIPEDFRVTLLSNTPNTNGILRSKATGEPSTDSAYAVVLAMHNAIASAREDVGNTDWFDITGPVTPEDIARWCLTKESHLTL